MQIFMKTRDAARSASFGSKVLDNWQGLPEHLKGVNNGKNSPKRWGRAVDAKHSQKEIMTLKSIKDYRNVESAKVVKVLKVKKTKQMIFA